MAKGTLNLQDAFLNQVRREGVPVTIYLVNGVQIRGLVRGFDSFTVVVESEGRQLLIYKHALSTVVPSVPVSLAPEARRAPAAAAADRDPGVAPATPPRPRAREATGD